MEKAMMRIVFCSVPAVCAGAVMALIDIRLGIVVAAVVFGFGFDVTTARPERGEF